jgi:Holliday junction resolvasome RuvABC endonuclease subunit
MMRILGLDISSSCIGYGCIDANLEDHTLSAVEIDHYKPMKDGDLFERLAQTRKDMKRLFKRLKPDCIAIEDIIQFMGKGSSANTIIVLAQFNRMIGLTAYDYLKEPPSLYAVISIRSGIKLDKKLPPKEDVPEVVAKWLGVDFPYVLNKKGKQSSESNDRADGTAVALHHALRLMKDEE